MKNERDGFAGLSKANLQACVTLAVRLRGGQRKASGIPVNIAELELEPVPRASDPKAVAADYRLAEHRLQQLSQLGDDDARRGAERDALGSTGPP